MRDRLPAAAAGRFYRKLDETLEAIGFAGKVREICRPAYCDTSAGGRPGIDPAVYFKMLMIGFFENLPSERAIASRCADSFSLRAFLGYDLTENTPEHSSLSVIRSRLGKRGRGTNFVSRYGEVGLSKPAHPRPPLARLRNGYAVQRANSRSHPAACPGMFEHGAKRGQGAPKKFIRQRCHDGSGFGRGGLPILRPHDAAAKEPARMVGAPRGIRHQFASLAISACAKLPAM